MISDQRKKGLSLVFRNNNKKYKDIINLNIRDFLSKDEYKKISKNIMMDFDIKSKEDVSNYKKDLSLMDEGYNTKIVQVINEQFTQMNTCNTDVDLQKSVEKTVKTALRENLRNLDSDITLCITKSLQNIEEQRKKICNDKVTNIISPEDIDSAQLNYNKLLDKNTDLDYVKNKMTNLFPFQEKELLLAFIEKIAVKNYTKIYISLRLFEQDNTLSWRHPLLNERYNSFDELLLNFSKKYNEFLEIYDLRYASIISWDVYVTVITDNIVIRESLEDYNRKIYSNLILC